MGKIKVVNALLTNHGPAVNVIFEVADCYANGEKIMIPIRSVDDVNTHPIPTETTFENLIFLKSEPNAPQVREAIEAVVGKKITFPPVVRPRIRVLA